MRLCSILRLALLWALFVGAMPAQVELRYQIDGQTHTVVGIKNGHPTAQIDGVIKPVSVGGEFKFVAVEDYAEPIVSLNQYYRLRMVRREAGENTMVQVSYDLEVKAETDAHDLFYAYAWQVDGRAIRVGLKKFRDLEAGESAQTFGHFNIRNSDRDGILRIYLFSHGKSVSGVGREYDYLAPLKSAMDAGDFEQAMRWLRGAGRGRKLPMSILEQIIRAGNREVLAQCLGDRNISQRKGRDGANLLLAAAETGRSQCLQAMLDYGVSAKSFDKQRVSALHRATRAGAHASMRKLLEAGSKSNRKSASLDETPIEFAIIHGDFRALEILTEFGAKWPKKSQMDKYLSTAIRKGNVGMAELLLRHGATLAGSSLIVPVAFTGDHEMVKLLLSHGARVDEVGSGGETALMGAAFSGNQSLAKLLLEAGASLLATDTNGRTAVSWAAAAGHRDLALGLARELPAKRALLSRTLHDALLFGHEGLAALMVADGAEFDLKSDDIDEVLDTIIRNGNLSAFRSALSQGLDINRTLFDDWSLAALSLRYDRQDFFEELKSHSGLNELEIVEPAVAKMAIEVRERASGISPDDIKGNIQSAKAKVDIFIDAEGYPRAPVLREATDQEFGLAAIRNIMLWRFNSTPGHQNIWRRVIVPLVYSAEAFSHSNVYPIWEVEAIPTIKDNPVVTRAIPSGEQAAWVKFLVKPNGEVSAPVVLSVTESGAETEALRLVNKWRFYPAVKDAKGVWYQHEGIVLLSTGGFLESSTPIILPDEDGAENSRFKLVRISRVSSDRRGVVPTPHRGLVLLRFDLDAHGFPENIRALSSSDSSMTDRAINLCEDMRYEVSDEGDAETPEKISMLLAIPMGTSSPALAK